jgi:hypothetical protein
MRKSILAAAFAWAYISGLAVSQAQTVHQVDFDPIRPSFGYSYAYSGYGDDMGNHDTGSEVSATYDVTTLPVGTGTLDSSDWQLPPAPAYTYIGWGLGIGLFFNEGTRPTSGVLSDYTVSFDASVAGYLNDGLSTEISVILQAPDDDDEDTNAEEYRLDVEASLRPVLTDALQSFEFNLGDLLPPTAPNFDFPVNFEDTFIAILQVAPNTNADQIGLDDDNVITVTLTSTTWSTATIFSFGNAANLPKRALPPNSRHGKPTTANLRPSPNSPPCRSLAASFYLLSPPLA